MNQWLFAQRGRRRGLQLAAFQPCAKIPGCNSGYIQRPVRGTMSSFGKVSGVQRGKLPALGRITLEERVGSAEPLSKGRITLN